MENNNKDKKENSAKDGAKENTQLKTATATMAQPKAVEKDFRKEVHFELSVRRKDVEYGLPGDDKTVHNFKIGSSLKGRAPLAGLSLEEEKIYLPDILGISSEDVSFRTYKRDYWNNISERVPHDDEGTNSRFPGRYVSIHLIFTDKAFCDAFTNADDFDKKGTVLINAQKAGVLDVTPDSVADYILFRYCLVYSRVANNKKDIGKSAKISFYLYSKNVEDAKKFEKFELSRRADKLFDVVREDEAKINAILRLFKLDPDDTFLYPDVRTKILALDEKIKEKPKAFITFANDKNLGLKALIQEAVSLGIVHNPSNTEVYYFGDSKEVTLGKTLEDAVLFLKSNDPKNSQIKDSIESQIVSFKR